MHLQGREKDCVCIVGNFRGVQISSFLHLIKNKTHKINTFVCAHNGMIAHVCENCTYEMLKIAYIYCIATKIEPLKNFPLYGSLLKCMFVNMTCVEMITQ